MVPPFRDLQEIHYLFVISKMTICAILSSMLTSFQRKEENETARHRELQVPNVSADRICDPVHQLNAERSYTLYHEAISA